MFALAVLAFQKIQKIQGGHSPWPFESANAREVRKLQTS